MLIVFDPDENDDENADDGSESGDNRRLSIRLSTRLVRPSRLVDGARVTPIDRPRVGFFHRIRPSVCPSVDAFRARCSDEMRLID